MFEFTEKEEPEEATVVAVMSEVEQYELENSWCSVYRLRLHVELPLLSRRIKAWLPLLIRRVKGLMGSTAQSGHPLVRMVLHPVPLAFGRRTRIWGWSRQCPVESSPRC